MRNKPVVPVLCDFCDIEEDIQVESLDEIDKILEELGWERIEDEYDMCPTCSLDKIPGGL